MESSEFKLREFIFNPSCALKCGNKRKTKGEKKEQEFEFEARSGGGMNGLGQEAFD